MTRAPKPYETSHGRRWRIGYRSGARQRLKLFAVRRQQDRPNVGARRFQCVAGPVQQRHVAARRANLQILHQSRRALQEERDHPADDARPRVSLQSEDYDEQTLRSLAETLVRV